MLIQILCLRLLKYDVKPKILCQNYFRNPFYALSTDDLRHYERQFRDPDNSLNPYSKWERTEKDALIGFAVLKLFESRIRGLVSSTVRFMERNKDAMVKIADYALRVFEGTESSSSFICSGRS